MEKPRGCAECLATDKTLNQHSFYDILGAKFILFVCTDCITGLMESVEKMSVGEQQSYFTKLGQIIKRGGGKK